MHTIIGDTIMESHSMPMLAMAFPHSPSADNENRIPECRQIDFAFPERISLNEIRGTGQVHSDDTKIIITNTNMENTAMPQERKPLDADSRERLAHVCNVMLRNLAYQAPRELLEDNVRVLFKELGMDAASISSGDWSEDK